MMTNSIEFDQRNSAFAQEAIKKANASAVAFLLYDRNQAKPVTFLHHTAVSQDVIDLYSSSVYQYDPMLQYSIFQNQESSFTAINCKDEAMVPELYEEKNRRYWDTLGSVGFWETATCKLALSNNMSLVIGLILLEPERKRGCHIVVDKAMNVLDRWLQSTRDHMVESSLRHCYQQSPLQAGNDHFSAGISCLTKRELQVVDELAKGHSNKEISHSLFLSTYTVENHLKRIYKKLGVDSRAALIAGVNQYRSAVMPI